MHGVSRGFSGPLGATVREGGVNFSVFSRNARLVELLLFENASSATPAAVIPLDPTGHRSYHYWHAFVPGLGSGQIYAYRAHGANCPELGQVFDGDKVLLDPYGLSVAVPKAYDREAASCPGDNCATAMKSVVVDPKAYDWEGDQPLGTPASKSVIYELHVRGFTAHESSGVSPEKRGTYAGLIEKIPYLQDLGITAVELLPVFQFDASDAPAGLVNYWGYQPVSFFAPHLAYSSRQDPLAALTEFRDMVKALHRAGIEVILDVVFNHTTEGGEGGPTLCYRGLANDTYYILEQTGSKYANYTGCGNTLNANQTVVRRMIQDSLRYWVTEMHVDGFRFDLASVLTRDEQGNPKPNPPIVWDIESDPLLSGTKLIAEAWDAAGLYQVGTFVGDAWCEWNGRFRDDVRRFLKSDRGTVAQLASRLVGSPDIFGHEPREAEQSINFVTCHDGFTLNDLVTYDRKHNEDNLENNRDGMDDNFSWNCGTEGPSEDPRIEQLRNRQVKNFIAIEMMAAGMPMLLMGDEVRRSQRGNNNAYCQDTDLSWLDWSLLGRHSDVHRFVKLMCGIRAKRDTSVRGGGLSLVELLEQSEVKWHGVELGKPDWGEDSHAVALELTGVERTYRMYGICNAYWESLSFELPWDFSDQLGPWRRCMDTSLPSPNDIVPLAEAGPVYGTHYVAAARSVVLLCQLL
jgi:glycogen operon protein